MDKYDLIVTIVNRGFSDYVVDIARNDGASGATIIYGRGSNIEMEQKFWGVNMHPEKELVLVLVAREDKVKIMKAIAEGTNLNEAGKGLCFSMPVNNIAGLAHVIEDVNTSKKVYKRIKKAKKEQEENKN